ncbi:DUF1493 family protein [Paraburkholderia sp. SUR17]|uniref:DUF1493 family protein n=1 Tax=Paraburkholderia sp. SUR17 TaxID=3034358 RepID=UPI0024081BC1|nr:DUF1493 family protein [Paraburkholderia sp. SUR17]WEY40091.1 DUF1493 family protein [Paraburkholderia sp. SUR17]
MQDRSWSELEAFVRTEAGLGKSKPLSPATRLSEDLGQTGDDANEFMGRFFEKFSVDPGDFDFHRYFLMEGEGMLYSLFRRVVLRKPHTFEREPLTLAMLHKAMLSKRWESASVAGLS